MSRRLVDRRTVIASTLVVGSLIAACGVPTGDGTFEPIEEVSPALVAEATTTVPPTTTTTTIPDATVTTLATTTTMAPETLETMEIYFLSRGLLRPVELTEVGPIASTDVIEALEAGPPEQASNLTTAVPAGLVNDVEIAGGIVTIDLDAGEFDTIVRRDQQRAIAQMVFTFVLNLRGVGLAQFTKDGGDFAVPRGDNRLTADPVSTDDYTNLLADQPAVPATTSTTTTTTTVAPEAEPAEESSEA